MYIVAKQTAAHMWKPSNFPEAKFAVLQTIFSTMMGTIKTLTEKGFGFITPEDGAKDLFFHSSALVDVTYDELSVGDKVSFETESSDKGPRAVNVMRA